MGNHEFCTRCHASDFHYGLTCEEAYPEKLARAEAERAQRKKDQEKGERLCKKLLAKLRKQNIPAELDYYTFSDGSQATKVVIHGRNLIGNRAKAMDWTNHNKPREPVDEFYMGG